MPIYNSHKCVQGGIPVRLRGPDMLARSRFGLGGVHSNHMLCSLGSRFACIHVSLFFNAGIKINTYVVSK
jgi:hypothetical protein